jgi:hypothetical protein
MKMKNPKTLIKLQLALLALIAAATPCLYAQCVGSTTCPNGEPGVAECVGNNPLGTVQESNDALWLASGDPCGTVYINKAPTGDPCGDDIVSDCGK